MIKHLIKKIILFSRLGLLMIAVWSLNGEVLFSQNDKEPVDEKKTARIGLSYSNINDNGPRLTATVKTKVDRSYENVKGVRVYFYFNEIDEVNKIGMVMSNHKGEAILPLPDNLIHPLAKLLNYSFYATIENDDNFEDNDKDLEIKRSHLTMKLEKEDSLNIVQLFFGAPDSSGQIIPVEDIEVKVYVQRLFGLLAITEDAETTDEEGLINLEFPTDVPGDQDGNITIVSKIEDHDEYGTLIGIKTINWGVPLRSDSKIRSHELWSSRANAPVYLIVLVNSMIIGIWGIIGYIIFQLVKIRRLGISATE